MELADVKSIWQAYDSKLEKSLQLNLHCLELIQTQKLKSKLAPLLWHRAIELFLHAVAVALLVIFLIYNFSQLPYAISAFALLIFYCLAIVMCIKQIIIIRRMDYSNDIVSIQSSLLMLQTHVVNYMRIAVLCIPAFLAYPMVVSKAIHDFNLTGLSFMDIRAGYQGNWWNIQLLVTVILTPLAIWFYREVSYKNIHKKWVKKTIQKTLGARITKSIELIKELKSLRQDILQ